MSDDEEIVLFSSIKDNVKFFRQIEILLYTGMRRGELFKIEWRDVDLIEGYINIRKEITKTGKARIVPMLSNVQTTFENLRGEAGDVQATDKIFAGSIWESNKLTSEFREVCDGLGFNDLTVHSLRHTFSTRADECKVGAFAQKALLGHSQLKMTDRYTHISKETLKASFEGMEQRLSRIKDTKPKTEIENDVKQSNLLEFKKT